MVKIKKRRLEGGVLGFFRALLVTDVITLLILILLAFILYKWGLSETLMRISTLFIYIISCMCGGMLLAKGGKKRAFIWGLLLGTAYYLSLLLIAILLPVKPSTIQVSIVLNLAICALAGMTGAMIVRK